MRRVGLPNAGISSRLVNATPEEGSASRLRPILSGAGVERGGQNETSRRIGASVQLTSLVTASALFANTCCSSTGPMIIGETRCGAKMASRRAVTTAAVAIGDNFFRPGAVTVARDSSRTATVTWTWTGRNPHSVTFDEGGPNSVVQRSGTFSRRFNGVGSFTYFCSVHGRAIMSGTVTVE